MLARYVFSADGLLPGTHLSTAQVIWLIYPVICWLSLIASMPLWLIPKLLERVPKELLANDSTDFDIAAHVGYRPVGDRSTDWLSRIAANEILRLRIRGRHCESHAFRRNWKG